MPSRAVVFAALLLLALLPCHAEKTLHRPPGTTRYAQMVTELKSLAARSGGRMTLAPIGYSVKGRALWMATVRVPSVAAESRAINYPSGGPAANAPCRAKEGQGCSLSSVRRTVGVFALQTGNSLPGPMAGMGNSLPGTNARGWPSPSRHKIFYLCRLHGHEPASTEGALAFLTHLVDAAPGSALAETLSHVTVYVVPMANPDGAEAFLRQNAHGKDLNRDWRTRTQPEIRALYRAITRLRPDLMTDQHELYPDDTRPDFTEAVSFGSGAPDAVSAACDDDQAALGAWMASQGVPIVNHWVDDRHPARLTHRFCGVVLGIPTLLFETNRLSGTGRSVAARAHAHTMFMTAVLKLGAGEREQMLSDAAARGFLPQPKPAVPAPEPEAAP